MSASQRHQVLTAKKDIQLSKTLSWLLRHAAIKEGVQISSEGYIKIKDLLNHHSLKDKFTLEDIKRVVETNDKQRFTLRGTDDSLEISANQGHSLKEIDKLSLIPIAISENLTVIHGTFRKNWISIKTEGINRMKRNHIHFATELQPHQNISGIRRNAEVFIYVNLKLAISEGIQFYKSINGAILSPGNDKGIIEPKYFLKVHDINGQILY